MEIHLLALFRNRWKTSLCYSITSWTFRVNWIYQLCKLILDYVKNYLLIPLHSCDFANIVSSQNCFLYLSVSSTNFGNVESILAIWAPNPSIDLELFLVGGRWYIVIYFSRGVTGLDVGLQVGWCLLICLKSSLFITSKIFFKRKIAKVE